MSLDGFIAGAQHAMDSVFEYPAPVVAWEVMRMTGARLAGRHTYDVGVRDAGKPSGAAHSGAWTGPSFVLTHRPPEPPDGKAKRLDAGVALKAALPVRPLARRCGIRYGPVRQGQSRSQRARVPPGAAARRSWQRGAVDSARRARDPLSRIGL
jgi:hypothetical protein